MSSTLVPHVSSPEAPVVSADENDADFVFGLEPESLLGRFNRAGVLAPVDVHVALRLNRLSRLVAAPTGAGENCRVDDEAIALAVALAVRALAEESVS